MVKSIPTQLQMFGAFTDCRDIEVSPEVAAALAIHSPVAIGVSGGKDSCAVAFATNDYLNSIGHRGPRILIHSDLGRVEWKDSAPTCERLAKATDLELVTVRREAGDMMDRWHTRWENNKHRYINLECVKLILPWSTPSMRFCTSELKTAVICRDLVKRFPGQTILSVTGIRREESSNRAKSPVSSVQNKLTSKTQNTCGFDWHSILGWSKASVFAYLAEKRFQLHEAYTVYGAGRVSCALCIMQDDADKAASVSCVDNHDIYREMVDLEVTSTFSFQDGKWLADLAPWLLSPEVLARVPAAKEAARRREAAEGRITDRLLYVKGWPACIPTLEEAKMLCEVRLEVAAAVGLDVLYTEPAALIARYEELMEINRQKELKKAA